MMQQGLTDAPSSLTEESVTPSPSPSPSLKSLRHDGAQRVDPVRFFHLEVLSRRASEATGEVQRVLQARLDMLLTDYAERARQVRQMAGDGVVPSGRRAPRDASTPLGELNRYIHAATKESGSDRKPGQVGRTELKSVRRFREVWLRIAAADQVDQAIGRGPENAGPLNSHMLVLRSLALMQKLSPDYLRRFLSHVDTLLWLDEQGHQPSPAEVKPVRRSRSKK